MDASCVGSIDKFYQRSGLSNYGPYVRYWAPGSLINVAKHTDDDGFTLDSGSSCATAHVSGVIAHFVGYESQKDKDLDNIRKRLYNNEQYGLISGIPEGSGSINLLVNTGIHNPKRPADKPCDDTSLPETASGAGKQDGGH